jgi:putative component of membrane protein insertase Oxa1/YidC/SpoIIIJ protein YidD
VQVLLILISFYRKQKSRTASQQNRFIMRDSQYMIRWLRIWLIQSNSTYLPTYLHTCLAYLPTQITYLP